MAQPKKGTLCQKLFVCVDSTDFASVESGVTSNFTTTYLGVNHGSAAASSGAVSKAISVVHSGLMRMTCKTTENNYDEMLVKIVHASCADQHLIWSNRTNDDADVISRISDLASNITSQVSDLASLASDAHSAAAQGNSRALVLQSRLSDVESAVDLVLGASHLSDLASRIWADATASNFMSDMVSRLSDLASAVSDAHSAAVAMSASDLSDIRSAITAGGAINASDMSDLRSAIAAVTATVSASDMSDIRSAITAAQSDINSHVSGIAAATVSASDISDIASAVKVVQASRLSDILSHALQANSRVKLLQSAMSDVESQLDVTNSDMVSRLSDLMSVASDAHSAAAQANSRALVLQSSVSDLDSQVLLNASMISDIDSQLTLTVSQISDIESQIDAGVTLTTSGLSDVGSRVWADITSAGANKLADHTWRRAVQSAVDSSDGDTKIFRSPLGMVCKMVNKWKVDGTTVRFYEDDDTTEIGTQTAVTDSDADPIIGLDTN